MAHQLATFKIDPTDWTAFKHKARMQGTNATAVLKVLVKAYLDGIDGLGNLDSIDGAGVTALAQQLEAIEARLSALEAAGRAGQSTAIAPTPAPAPVEPVKPTSEPPVKTSPPPGDDLPQAAALQAAGYSGNVANAARDLKNQGSSPAEFLQARGWSPVGTGKRVRWVRCDRT